MTKNFYRRLNFVFAFLIFISTGFSQTADSVIFRDDFNQPFFKSIWQAHPSWFVLNGSAFNFIDGTGGTLKTTAAYDEPSYVIRTSAKGFSTNYYREFRITFGQADLSTPQLYQIKYTAYGGGRLTLSKSTDNIYSAEVLDEVAVFPNLNGDQWYTFKIARYKSGLIQVYIDNGTGYSGSPLLEAIDSSYSGLGHTGWQVDTQTFAEDFFVDWFSATKPGVEKPATREKPVEDSLITQVTAKSGRAYPVNKLVTGVKQLTDRDYTITSVPDYLNGASFIQSANMDKLNTADSFLTFFVKKPSVVYIGYDPRATAKPNWLNDWTKTTDRIQVSDQKVGYLDVYSRLFEFGSVYPFPIVLGGNAASPQTGVWTNYLVAAVERPLLVPLQAEDALLSGAMIATDHINYDGTGFVDFKNASDDYIEWTIQIDVPGNYNFGFRFSNGGFQDRILDISDNGAFVSTADFSPTFSWSNWSFLSGPNVFLSAGVHKIRVTATGTSGPNIDELSLFYESPSPFETVAVKSARNIISTENPLPALAYKAYPNPFSQSTKIYYGLKEKAKVTLSIYTLQGQQVEVLENSIHEAGNYQAIFNADKYARGIYIYKLQTGNDVKTGKLIKE